MVITAATEKALEVSGVYFKDLVAFHLKNKYEAGFEIVALDPGKFHDAIFDLVGEFSTRILETLIIQSLLGAPMSANHHAASFIQIIQKIRSGELKMAEPVVPQ
jgi:hypothetical protein